MTATDERPATTTSAPPTIPWRERPLARLAAFGLALAVLFGVGLGVGALVGPDAAPTGPSEQAPSGGHGGMPASGGSTPGGDTVEGLTVTRDGYTLEILGAPARAGVPGELAFRIVGPGGTPVTTFTPTHDKPLHLIVVRRDQAGFQHLHPVMGLDGTWRTPVTLSAGDQRVLADFAPDGRGAAITLGRDLPVGGDYEPVPLPAPSRTATTADGYTVTLDGALTAGASSLLTLSVSRNGVPVTDLQPYLAAYGHLVVLRTGDLAYLHVHPDGAPGDGVTPPGPDVRFAAEVPTPGTYRLYLDFAHQGVVRTVEFTAVAAPAPGAPRAGEPAAPAEPAGHGH